MPLSLFTDPAMHHVRVQAMRQGHSAYAGPRLCTQGEYLCLQLRAVFTPPWALLIQRLFHRLHDPPSWGRCPLQAVLSRWDRQLHTTLHLWLVFQHLQGVAVPPKPRHITMELAMPVRPWRGFTGLQHGLRDLAQAEATVRDVRAQARTSVLGGGRGTHIGPVALSTAVQEAVQEVSRGLQAAALPTSAWQRVGLDGRR